MARILLTWELGGGIGHLAGLEPLADELARRGHQPVFAVRDVAAARAVLRSQWVDILPAPLKRRQSAGYIARPVTYCQMLLNIGFDEDDDLESFLATWSAILREVQPAVVVCEHSPTALFAAAARGIPRVVYGCGWNCPPTVGGRLPILRPFEPHDDQQLEREEETVGARLNRISAAHGGRRIERLADLYGLADDTLLTTFAEIDHFELRSGGEYWGIWPFDRGERFDWPAGDGQRVFAYLKPSKNLPAVFHALNAWRLPTLVYGDGLDGALEREFASATLRFARHPLAMRQAAAECDLAIYNGNHATSAAMLRAGKPVFVMPLQFEQQLLSRRIRLAGCGEAIHPDDAASVEPKLRQMLSSGRFADAARRFAAKYVAYDAADAVNALASRVETLIAQ